MQKPERVRVISPYYKAIRMTDSNSQVIADLLSDWSVTHLPDINAVTFETIMGRQTMRRGDWVVFDVFDEPVFHTALSFNNRFELNNK